MTWYLVFLGLVAVSRMAEALWSKTNSDRRCEQGSTLVSERVFPWMVVTHTAMFVMIPLEMLAPWARFGGWLSIVAIAMTFVAILLRIWVLASMRTSWNVRIVYSANMPIISHGPYSHVRHPNYTVVITELLCIPLIFHLYLSAALLSTANAMVLYHRIANEERALEASPEWRRTMADKPRFLPRFRSP